MAMEGGGGGSVSVGAGGSAEAALKQVTEELARQKAVYREGFVELKALKAAIARLQGQLEREAKGRAQHALDGAAALAEQQQQQQQHLPAKQAWG